MEEEYSTKSWLLGNDSDCDTCGMSWNAAEFDRWLLQIEYDAWNEGHRAGWTNKEAVINGTGEFTRNPYIK